MDNKQGKPQEAHSTESPYLAAQTEAGGRRVLHECKTPKGRKQLVEVLTWWGKVYLLGVQKVLKMEEMESVSVWCVAEAGYVKVTWEGNP